MDFNQLLVPGGTKVRLIRKKMTRGRIFSCV
jgi:hypothetical protein